MTTNEQRDTAAILQMKADLDEAIALLWRVSDALQFDCIMPMTREDITAFLARTEHETANR